MSGPKVPRQHYGRIIYIYMYICSIHYLYELYAYYIGKFSQPKHPQRDFLWAAAEASPAAQVPRKDKDAGKHCGGKVAGDPR